MSNGESKTESEAGSIQAIIKEIASLRKEAESSVSVDRTTLSAITHNLDKVFHGLPRSNGETLTSDMWDGLPADRKASVQGQLLQGRAALRGIINADGPSDPKSIMHKIHASNWWILALAILGVFGTSALLWEIITTWEAATTTQVVAGTPVPPSEAAVLEMIVLMGALGGLIHLTGSLSKYVGNRQMLRSWILYYLLMPVEGAALASVIYLLLRVGVLAPSASGGTSTANLNLQGLYAFAGLTGLFSKQAVEMLADVFGTIFKKVSAKDSLEKKPPAERSPTEGASE